MLTKNDLQQIRIAVREEVQEELETIRTSISFLKIDVSSLRISVSSIRTDVKSIRKKLDKVSRDVNTLIPYFDKRITILEKEFKTFKEN